MSTQARLALLSAALLALFLIFGLFGIVSREDVQGWIEPLGGWGAPVFAVVSALLGCVFVPGPLLAALGGVLFGTWVGFAVSLVSAVLSALIAMAIGRRTAEVHGPARTFVERRGLLAVVAQRLAPGVPDAPFNYVAGTIGVRARDLALGTAIGVAPRALAYTALGSLLWS